MKYIFAYLLAALLLSCATFVIGNAQVSKFFKDGKWWVSWDSKDAQVQIFRPIKYDSVKGSLPYALFLDKSNRVKTDKEKTQELIKAYKKNCANKTFDLIKDSAFNETDNAYVITFTNGKSVESGLLGTFNETVMIPPAPWSKRDWFSQHLMFKVMAACTDDNWLYCPCGAKFPLVKK